MIFDTKTVALKPIYEHEATDLHSIMVSGGPHLTINFLGNLIPSVIMCFVFLERTQWSYNSTFLSAVFILRNIYKAF